MTLRRDMCIVRTPAMGVPGGKELVGTSTAMEAREEAANVTTSHGFPLCMIITLETTEPKLARNIFSEKQGASCSVFVEISLRIGSCMGQGVSLVIGVYPGIKVWNFPRLELRERAH